MAGMDSPDEPLELPITPELDLHTFRPQDVGELLPEYLLECRRRGILEVRIVHGKGRGQVLRSVHAILARLPEVESFALAGAGYGGSGATFAKLKPL
jgi:dsDNA-specific endonuclease/ATPase MutS2